MLPATFLDPLSLPSPWSKGGSRSAMLSGFRSRESSIRLRSQRSMACRRFRARASRKSSAGNRASTMKLAVRISDARRAAPSPAAADC